MDLAPSADKGVLQVEAAEPLARPLSREVRPSRIEESGTRWHTLQWQHLCSAGALSGNSF
jgi:hypothetical protein